MAKQTEIAYESKEWQPYNTGGTIVRSVDLNRMEQGISDACAAVDELRTKRLPTYLVAKDGDTATQDLYLEPILGPCLILDLAERATYYDNGEDADGHERYVITSGADIDALRDSLSRKVSLGGRASSASVYCDSRYDQRVMVSVTDSENGGTYILIAADGYIGLYDSDSASWVGRADW